MRFLSKTISFNRPAVELLEIFKDQPNLFFLDSSLSETKDGQFSYLGFSPFKTARLKDFDQLRKLIKPYLGVKSKLNFPAGAVGYIGYEGDLWFGLYEGVLSIDHHHKTLTITSRSQRRIEEILFQLEQAPRLPEFKGSRRKLSIQSNTTQKEYIAAVKKALEHIRAGDIYQINLAHQLTVAASNWRRRVHPAHMYQQLRRLSPSPFSAYLDDGSQLILSSSPERFLQLQQGIAQVRPMKGTRPRGKTAAEDKRQRRELETSAKEKAELLMVTDLERNDLGRVCQYGTVKVKALRTIEEYSTVFQATATVEGKLYRKFDQFDLLKATFPSGSVTGTPKIEAMKIIHQLEKAKRGLYTGALGYISFTGDMDFNVLIRTLFLQRNKISFYVGSGIVADSNPKKEYEETLIKSKAMVQALQGVL